MNVISVLIWLVVAYIVYLVLGAIGLVNPWALIDALLVFVLGVFGTPYAGGPRV